MYEFYLFQNFIILRTSNNLNFYLFKILNNINFVILDFYISKRSINSQFLFI